MGQNDSVPRPASDVLTATQLSIYVHELSKQCTQATYGFAQLQERLQQVFRPKIEYLRELRRLYGHQVILASDLSEDPTASFYADAFVTHAGRASRLLWPGTIRGGREARAWAESRAFAVRNALGVSAEALRNRALRDAIDHFDERLDDYARASTEPHVYDLQVTTQNVQLAEGDLPRLLDAETLTYRLGSAEIEMHAIAGDVLVVGRAASSWVEAEAARLADESGRTESRPE